jgi:hypothetical protein
LGSRIACKRHIERLERLGIPGGVKEGQTRGDWSAEVAQWQGEMPPAVGAILVARRCQHQSPPRYEVLGIKEQLELLRPGLNSRSDDGFVIHHRPIAARGPANSSKAAPGRPAISACTAKL